MTTARRGRAHAPRRHRRMARAKSASQDVETAATKGSAFDPAVQKPRPVGRDGGGGGSSPLGVLAGAGGAALWFYGHHLSAAAESDDLTGYRFAPRALAEPEVGPGCGSASDATHRIVSARSLVAVALTGVAGCGYSPEPGVGDAAVRTATTAAPRATAAPTDAPAGRTARRRRQRRRTGGSAAAVGNRSTKFIGHVDLRHGASTRTSVCTDGTNETRSPWDDFFDVVRGRRLPRSATYYYCDWNLDVNAAGTSTAIRAGQELHRARSERPHRSRTPGTARPSRSPPPTARAGRSRRSLPYDLPDQRRLRVVHDALHRHHDQELDASPNGSRGHP